MFRLLLAIPFWFLMDNLGLETYRIIIFCLCIFAAITDILDGYLARRFNEVTEMGKIIDPLADKVVIAVIIVKLFVSGEIPAYYFWIIILRDVIIFLGGIYVSKRIGRVLPSNMLGKITVASIGIFILIVLAQIEHNNIIYFSFFYLSILLTFASLTGYMIRSVEFMKKH